MDAESVRRFQQQQSMRAATPKMARALRKSAEALDARNNADLKKTLKKAKRRAKRRARKESVKPQP
jgi:hypothetical protein